ncbi:cupin domain-containing protein [Ktedonobacter racemifer]|jgi:mannose-6-phosphate isomerase-like protein (cupin superfamily)|uniref:Cupin 2 conserved barrel domain protein n=1 Tax=Ktedonobacter racemifer DSM 44963 TaxID=485913 RepID=D6TV38_KTERA|nr:cupin domain-containing protein [Ktedonobacter racemifer]EFH84138.1 Cupin 2 conserved barrel domain protein [Ktedonobacter racemifer DSM 44963]
MGTIITKEQIRLNETAFRFQGGDYGDVPASFFWVFTQPGRGPGLHVHPYQEVFILQEGQATFTIGDETLELHAGEITIAPANTPHKFVNSGVAPLQMVSIHPSKHVIQEFLEQ